MSSVNFLFDLLKKKVYLHSNMQPMHYFLIAIFLF